MAQRSAVHWIGFLPVKGGNSDSAIGHQGGIDELRHILHAAHSLGNVSQGNQRVSLAASILGIQAKDGSGLTALAGQSQANIIQKGL
jgi:hypothetical protein